MDRSALHRFLGGSPLAVLVRLAIVSLIVGALMSWFDIDPASLFYWFESTVSHLWATGFDALNQLGRFLLAGASLVVPIWLLTRLFSIGDMRRTPTGRWPLPGAPPERAGTEPKERSSPRT